MKLRFVNHVNTHMSVGHVMCSFSKQCWTYSEKYWLLQELRAPFQAAPRSHLVTVNPASPHPEQLQEGGQG